jgi:hypothetical protein
MCIDERMKSWLFGTISFFPKGIEKGPNASQLLLLNLMYNNGYITYRVVSIEDGS